LLVVGCWLLVVGGAESVNQQSTINIQQLHHPPMTSRLYVTLPPFRDARPPLSPHPAAKPHGGQGPLNACFRLRVSI
jgi:hypothetical protein